MIARRQTFHHDEQKNQRQNLAKSVPILAGQMTNVTLSGPGMAEMLTSTSTEPGDLAVGSVEQLPLAAHEFAQIATLIRV